MLSIYSCVLTIAVLALILKLFLLKRGLREIGSELTLILSQDTNRLLGLSSRDRDLRRLADTLNRQLKILGKERHRYQDGDRALKEAVTNISHDLRTPLTAVSGYLELLDREKHSAQTRRCLDIIRQRVNTMKQLTEELFRYSLAIAPDKADNEKPEQLSLNRMLEESLLSFYEVFASKGISPQISLPDIPVVRILDKVAVSRIFSNIISNAAKYSASDFVVSLDSDGTVTFSNSAPNLTPVMTAQLFDRYFTVENLEHSAGLGLSIAKQLTEIIGGTIKADLIDCRLVIRVAFPMKIKK